MCCEKTLVHASLKDWLLPAELNRDTPARGGYDMGQELRDWRRGCCGGVRSAQIGVPLGIFTFIIPLGYQWYIISTSGA